MSSSGEDTTKKQDIWFPAKTYGWGWGVPITWQGWAVLLGCLGVGVAPIIYISTVYKGDTYCQKVIENKVQASCDIQVATGMYVVSGLLWLFAWTLILAMIASKKGAKPSWQWGNKKKHAAKSKAD